MKWLILGQMRDLQTGMYIVESIEKLGHDVAFVDTRALVEDKGAIDGQTYILAELNELESPPDVMMVLKGLEMMPETIKTIKARFPDAKLINWFFDVQLAGTDIWNNTSYHPTLELYDYFFCSLDGVADILRDKGFDNVYHVGEACFPPLHGEQYCNNFQETKYGEDVSFVGSIGLPFHSNRIKYLARIIKEGFNINIWGSLVGDVKTVPLNIRHRMTGTQVINDVHSMVCQNSLVNLGFDGRPDIEGSMSARIYRVLCAGGLYLTTATKGIDKYFKVNNEGEDITSDQEVVVFYDESDLINKLDFLLEHEDIRKSIAKNGQKKVLNEHTFVQKIEEIIEVIKQ